MNDRFRAKTCRSCTRPSVLCASEPTTAACSAIRRVLELERFRDAAPSSSSFLGEERDAKVSIRTIALLREWRRVDGAGASDAIAREIAHWLHHDLAEVDLDALIGDLCPRCGLEKSAAEGARDYWCQSCMDAARKEVE